MGCCKSKKNHEPIVHLLDKKKRECIENMFEQQEDGTIPPITHAKLRVLWNKTFTEYIANLFINHIFRNKEDPYITVYDLEKFYYDMVEGPTNIRAEILFHLLATRGGIFPGILNKFIRNLVESYILILEVINPEAYYSWQTNDEEYRFDLLNVADYCMKDLNLRNGRVGVDELERWLTMCSFTRDLFKSIMHYACQIDLEFMTPELPKADKYAALLRIPMVLVLSHFTKNHSKGHWRLLYNSWTDPQAWVIFQQQIVDQGPTLIVIEDDWGTLFGGFASVSWKVRNGFYGDENCFIFQISPRVNIWKSSRHHNHYQYFFDGIGICPRGLGFGGFLNYFGVYLSAEFGTGKMAEHCITFQNFEKLTSGKDFEISKMEVWGIGDPDQKALSLRGERRQKESEPVISAARRDLLMGTEGTEVGGCD